MNKAAVIILLLFISSCEMSEAEMRVIAMKDVERRMELLKREKTNECRNAALVIAERQADSIISEMRINPLNEHFYKPQLPVKPEFIETDSSQVNSKRSVKPLKE